MSTPFHFTPRVPAAPHPTPVSASVYSLPKPKALRPPIHNPYDKFTQPEFDAWIGGITGALRSALGQDDEKALPSTRNGGGTRQIIDEHSRYTSIEGDESADDLVDDSFAEVKARRAIGKGKARDPREGPGLRKEHSIQPIEIISSDEEEEEEVELSIAPFDEEESEVEEENDENEEESATEEYAWEAGQSSSQYIPSIDRRRIVHVQHEQLHDDDEGEYEEYGDEEYEDVEEGSDQLDESNAEVIEVLSDDEEAPQLKPSEPRRMAVSYEDDGGHEEEQEEEYDAYSEEEQDGEIMVPPGSQYHKYISGTRYLTDENAADEEEHGEIDDEIQEIQPPVSHDQSVRLSDEGGNYNGFPDRWQGSQLDVEDHYVEEDRTSGDTQDASRFSAEEVVDLEDGGEDHAEEVDNEMQPLSLDTSFPPGSTVSALKSKDRIEIPDRWSGPNRYAQDYYSGGQVVLTSDERVDPSHLGPGDSEYSVLDAEEEELAEEIEDEIQPLEADTSFPPQEPVDEDPPIIVDPWLGAQTYAQDFYYDGDVRILPGGRIDPFFLHGSADLDDGIDSFLTPGALSPNPSEERTSIGDDEGAGIQGPPDHYVSVPLTRGQPIPSDAELITVDDSDDETEQGTKPLEGLLYIGDTVHRVIYGNEIQESIFGMERGGEVVDEVDEAIISPLATEAEQHHDILAATSTNTFDKDAGTIEVEVADSRDEVLMDQHIDVSDGGDQEQVQVGDALMLVPTNSHRGSPEVVQSEIGRERSLEIATRTEEQDGTSSSKDISILTPEADELARFNGGSFAHVPDNVLFAAEVAAAVDEGVVDVTLTEQQTNVITVDNAESHIHELEAAALPNVPEAVTSSAEASTAVDEGVIDGTSTEQQTTTIIVDDAESQTHKLEAADLPATEVEGGMQNGDERHAIIDDVINIVEESVVLTPIAEHAENAQEEIVQTEEDAGDGTNRIHLQPLPSEQAHFPPSPQTAREEMEREETAFYETVATAEHEEVSDEIIPLSPPADVVNSIRKNAELNHQYSVTEASEDASVDAMVYKETELQDIEVISVASAFGAGDEMKQGEDIYSVEEMATDRRLSEKPYDRAMSLSIISIGPEGDEITPSIERDATPSILERVSSPGPSYESLPGQHEEEPTNPDIHLKELSVPPESPVHKDIEAEGISDVGLAPLEVILDAEAAAANIPPEAARPQSPIMPSTEIGGLLSSDVDTFDGLPATSSQNLGSNPSDIEVICPTPKTPPDVVTTGTSNDDVYEAHLERQQSDVHSTGDKPAIVAEDLLGVVSSTQLPDVLAESPAQGSTPIKKDHEASAVISPSPEEAKPPADRPVNIEDRYRQVAVPSPTANIFGRLPTAPAFINDAYPYNLSAPILSRLFGIPSRYGPQARSSASPHPPLRTHTPVASSSTPSTLLVHTPIASTSVLQVQSSLTPTFTSPLQTQPQTTSHVLQTQTSFAPPVAPQTDNSAETASAAGDWDDLDDFQYPPEQNILAEFRNEMPALPISQLSKAENEVSAVQVNTAVVQPAPNNNTANAIEIAKNMEAAGPAIVETSVPVSVSSEIKDTVDDAALHTPSKAGEKSESKAESGPNKPAKSSKKSAKRKRETSPGPQMGPKPVTGQKNKGRRSSKADRKGKAQELAAEAPGPTSEGIIHVRPRPKDLPTQTSAIEAPGKPVDVFSALPTYRILQTASRASSSAASDPSDKLAGAQQSPTVNKPSKLPVQPPPPPPFTSLFHAHGRGRKQASMSNIPPKLAKHIQTQKAPPIYASPPTKKSEIPAISTSATLPTPAQPLNPDQIASEITPLVIPTPEIQSITSASSVAPSDISPTVVSHFAASPAPVTPVVTSPTPSIPLSIPPLATSAAPAPPIVQTTTASRASPTVHTPSHHSKPARTMSMTSSPVTRSHCRYHRISLPREENGPRIWFLVPGCSLNDKELIEEEEIIDHGDATVEDSHRMIKDIESLNFHSDLIGILRQLVGLDILREQEVFYLPQPGEEVPRRNSLKKSTTIEKTAMVRVPADSSSYAGSPEYSGGYPGSPGSFRAVTSVGSRSPSISGLRSFLDSEKGSSFAPSDMEHSGDEEPDTKRSRLSPPDEGKSMGPPQAVQSKGKEKVKRSRKVKPKADEEAKEPRKPRKSTLKRGVKRSRTSEVYNVTQEGEPSSKKLKAHATEPSPSPEKPPPS